MSEIDEQSKQEMRTAIERLQRDAKFMNGELVLLNQDRNALRASYASLQEDATHMRNSIAHLRTALAEIVVLPEKDPNTLRCILVMVDVARAALAWPTDERRA